MFLTWVTVWAFATRRLYLGPSLLCGLYICGFTLLANIVVLLSVLAIAVVHVQEKQRVTRLRLLEDGLLDGYETINASKRMYIAGFEI